MGFGCALEGPLGWDLDVPGPALGGGWGGGFSGCFFGGVSGKISAGAPGEPGLTEFQGPRVELLGRSQGFNGAGSLCPSFPLSVEGAHGSVPTDTPGSEAGPRSWVPLGAEEPPAGGEEQGQHREWLL